MNGVGVCVACQHFESEHRLAEGGAIPDGPFVCRACGCAISQFSPVLMMTNAMYDRLTVRQKRTLQGASAEQADSAQLAAEVFRDPALRAKFERMAEESEQREPAPDDFNWLRGQAAS